MVAQHGEGLPCSGGSIGEDGGVLTGKDSLDEWFDSLRVDLLGRLIAVDAVEGIALLLGPVVYFQHLAVLLLELALDGVEDDLCEGGTTMRFS